MTMTSTQNSGGVLRTIVMMGLIVGTLDITSAFISFAIQTGKNPVTVLRFIAAAAFGKQGLPDTAMIMWGLVFHYIIAFSWTILFFTIYPRLLFMQKNRIVTGILYGVVIWLVMNFIVLPLTKLPPLPFRPLQAFIGVSILIIAIGLPLTFMTHRFYFGRK